jgi:signal peptidase
MPDRYPKDADPRRATAILPEDAPTTHTAMSLQTPKTPLQILRRLTGWIVTAAVLTLAAVMLVPTLLGYGRYVLVSGSMTGTYDTGSVVYTKDVPTSSLHVGQIITYAPPAGSSPMKLVTHRIVSRKMVDGKMVLRTKGDANPSADPWTFSLREPKQAVVRFGVPDAGYVVSAFSDPRVRKGLIGVPAVLVALLAVAGLFRDAAREAREEREGTTATDDAPVADGGPDDVDAPQDAPHAVVPHTVFPAALRSRTLSA